MSTESRYQFAKENYSKIGVDTDAAIERLGKIKISLHCWQGDDVIGFDHDGPLTGGIQTTGDYPGKATTPDELMADIDKALSLIPGTHKLSLHANYAIFENGEFADRDKLEPKHFAKWVAFAKERGLGIDFNGTYFSHPKAKQLTLANPDKEIRDFWISHTKACIRISEYFAAELGQPVLFNIWLPDGLKDVPADRFGPRRRTKEALDEILGMEYDKSKVFVSLEAKVFGIGMESYTVGSPDFSSLYATSKGIVPLLDNGHYHPTETVSDKISSFLLFNDRLALHLTRPVRWDSDHVVLFDDETREIAKEIIRNDALDKMFLGMDFFDASINRVGAWVVGMRNVQKALLYALLSPNKQLAEMQDTEQYSELMVFQEELKFYPFEDVWEQFCEQSGMIAGRDWFDEIKTYEQSVLSKRESVIE
ncbi:L-rhamnose isomerase [Clostridia bacterium]|nr:L-rhamnose isomerase [Clostridia bacterium]